MNRVTCLVVRLYCAMFKTKRKKRKERKKKAPGSHRVEPGMAQGSLPSSVPVTARTATAYKTPEWGLG